MEDFERIVAEVRRCELCAPGLPLGPKPVFRVHHQAKLLIVGQAPGTRVHDSGIPFNDQSGRRLRDWMGVDRMVFYDSQKIGILPMGFCYPGRGKSGDLPPRRECAETWRDLLLGLMPDIQLTLVIGKYAMDWHLKHRQKKNVTETVKAWREYLPDFFPLCTQVLVIQCG